MLWVVKRAVFEEGVKGCCNGKVNNRGRRCERLVGDYVIDI